MKTKLFRFVAILLTVVFTVSSMSMVIPTLVAAGTVEKTPVLPLLPISATGIGGTTAEIKTDKELFIKTDYAEISSDEYIQGILGDLPPKDNTVSSVMKITPMLSSTALKYNYATVTHDFKKTVNLTDEMGLKIATVSGGEYYVAEANSSQAYANIGYSKRNSFVGADGIMFYLKIDGPNIISPQFAAFKPTKVSRWKYDYNPTLFIGVENKYQYMKLGDKKWTTASAVADKPGNKYFGVLKFDSAFEGYVKIPFSSLVNDLGFTFNLNQDSIQNACLKMRGLGGDYGTVTAGPYFVVNKDSTSTKFEVNKAEFSAAPESVGARINGFKEPLKDADALLVYVKTDAANRISIAANMWDEYLGDIPNLELDSDATVYIAALGDKKWKEIKSIETDADNAIQFDKAFEGYIKIPISSFKEQQSSPFIAIYPEIDFITGVEVTLEGIGGKFGKVQAVPFLINDDKGTTSFGLPNDYKPPATLAAEVEPISGKLLLNNWATVSHKEVKTLDFTTAMGSLMTAKSETGYEAADIGGSQAYANFEYSSTSVNGYEGLVFYVKTESANLISPQIAFDMPADKTRWKYSWAPILMLKVGNLYEYMPIDGGEWQVGTAVEGVAANAYYGSIQFDGAFEGYIKVPFSSFANDSGFIFNAALDTVANIVYRAKGLGGNYGHVTFGPSMLLSRDGSNGITLKEAEPIIVNPVMNLVSNPTASKSKQEVVKPLDWTDAEGLKLTASAEYTTDNPGSSWAYSNFSTNNKCTFGNTTHVIWYVKTDCATTVVPKIAYDGPGVNIASYNPEMTLGVGKTYSYLPIGGSKWISSTAVPAWKSASGDTNGDGISDTYYGGIKFDAPFEGYIKFAVADLSNDHPKANNADRKTTIISNFLISVAKLGGQYGSVTAGPVFFTEKDTDSPIIELYKAPDPNDNLSVEVTPISGKTEANGIKLEAVNPLRGLTLEGYKLSTDKAWSVADEETAKNENVFGVTANTVLKDSNGLLIYAKADKDTVVAPEITLAASENARFSLSVGKKYSVLPFSKAEWQEYTAVKASDSDTASGGIKLEAGFEGYIRLPYDLLVNGEGLVINSETDSLSKIEFRLSNLGGKDNTVTIAPISLITNKGKSTDVVYPDSYNSKDPYERIQGIFERSKLGLAQGNYYMVGDSTRYLYGQPIFRIVRKALVDNYNMKCTLQALSGLKAEHWSDYTPGLDGPLFPTVGQLIEQIPGTGRNCIVDISLAINDAGKEPDLIYDFLKMGIDKIRKAKPDAVIVYTCPSLISSTKGNKNIHAAAEKIWKDKSIYSIDTMNDVFGGYYADYYVDTHHPNSLGYKMIGQYIVSKYVEGLTFEKIKIKPYTAPNVWAKKDLPVMESLGEIGTLDSSPWTMKNVIESPLPTLTTDPALEITSSPPADYEGVRYGFSTHWVSTEYDNVPIGQYSHLAFYVKVPKTKDNAFIMHMFTDAKNGDNGIFQFMANCAVQLLPMGETKWQHILTERVTNSIGGIPLPAGFEGLVKVSYSSMFPANRVKGEVHMSKIAYRFKYIGVGEERVIVGPVFGILQDNDTGPEELVYTSMPEATTIKSLYQIEDCDRFADAIMLYWEPFEGAKYYIAEAYSMTKAEKGGYEYRLAASRRCVPSSGVITDLMPGKDYAILIKAYDIGDNVIATYDYTVTKTADTDEYTYAIVSDEMNYDKVYYPNSKPVIDNKNEAPSNSNVKYLIIGGVSIVLLAGAAITFVIIYKRRKKNA